MHTDRTITTDDDLVCFTQTQSSERNAGLSEIPFFVSASPKSDFFEARTTYKHTGLGLTKEPLCEEEPQRGIMSAKRKLQS